MIFRRFLSTAHPLPAQRLGALRRLLADPSTTPVRALEVHNGESVRVQCGLQNLDFHSLT